MNKNVTCVFFSSLLFALILDAACLGPNWTVRETSTISVPDDYTTIQEAINNAIDGDTIFAKAGTYYENVVVNKTVSLVGEDVSTTIIDGNNTGHVIYIISDNVSISGFTVQNSGNIQMPDLDAGICLNGTTGCTISENRLVNNGFCGISLLYSNGNTITDNNLSSAGWGGIHLLGSSHNIISGNTIADKYGGINGHVSSNYNNITENDISNCTYGGFYHAASYNNICENNISAIAVEGIWLQDQVDYNVVAENDFVNNTVAIRVQGPNYHNTLSRNVITGAEYGIKIENNARYTHITNNIITSNCAGNDSWSAGIRLDSGWDSEIYLNIISRNCYGVLLYSSSPRVSVYGNNITGNEFGIRVASGGSSYLNVSDNIVMNNQGYGIGLTGFGGASNYATISRNLIVNNSDGIALGQYSNYNTILQNNISQNGYGFYIEYSTQNTIWRNNIIDNDEQVYVATGSINTWNDSYPSGGNYWSDYNGTDPNYDGIGDTPYFIDANNRDNYPLMGTFNSFHTVLDYDVNVISNSTMSNFLIGIQVDPQKPGFNVTSIRFYVTGEAGIGFCRICIPRALLNGTYKVFVNGTEIPYTLLAFSNETYSYLYFNYTHSTQEVIIIPEFSPLIILPLFMIATLLAVIVYKRKQTS